MISDIAELGNSDCKKSNTEPGSQNIRNIKDKHTLFREIQNLCLKNPEKTIVGQLNTNSLRSNFDLLRLVVQNRVDIFMISESKLDNSFPVAQSLGTLLLTDLIETEMVAEFYFI